RIRFEDGIVDNLVEVLPITVREKFQSACCAVGGALQTLSVDVLPNSIKQFAVCPRDCIEIFFRQPIAFARESFLDVKIGIAALNHGRVEGTLIKEGRFPISKSRDRRSQSAEGSLGDFHSAGSTPPLVFSIEPALR